jgi:LuxR family transcriptional regulator, maltose regulon positive regulatory protein
VARELFISVNTLKSHVKAVYRKLGAAGRDEAVAAARRAGLL